VIAGVEGTSMTAALQLQDDLELKNRSDRKDDAH
jgi:hypothetical protein